MPDTSGTYNTHQPQHRLWWGRLANGEPIHGNLRQAFGDNTRVVKNVHTQQRKVVSAMQEDILGTRRTAISETYVMCVRCNKPTRLRDAQIIQSSILTGTVSEYEYLCPDCQKELAKGEDALTEE